MKSFPFLALYVAVFLMCSGLRILNLSTVEEVREFPDTKAYVTKASWPLWSWGNRLGPLEGVARWWLHGRSLTVPLFYKLAGNVPYSIAIFQLCLSIMCWGLLATFVVRAVDFDLLKPFAFLIILLFSLSDHIIMWDSFLLSDSIALSLLALFVASWLWLLESWHWRKAVLMLTVASLWAFSRDTNAWVILMLAGFLLLVGSLWRSRRYLSIAAVFVMGFIANEVSQNYSKRWVEPFFNVVGRRILPNTERTAYFAQDGMPVTPALLRLSGQYSWSQDRAFFKDPALQEFRDWVYDHGKSSYTRFLLSHPAMTIREPFQSLEALIAPKLSSKTSYYWSHWFSPILPGTLAEVIYFDKWTLLWAGASGMILAFAVVAAIEKDNRRWLVPLLLIFLAYPHAALAWHGDANDVGRHALQASIQLRLGLWLLLLFAGNTLFLCKNKHIFASPCASHPTKFPRTRSSVSDNQRA
jgi:hypothetical protein